jgi:hypothetical protein
VATLAANGGAPGAVEKRDAVGVKFSETEQKFVEAMVHSWKLVLRK